MSTGLRSFDQSLNTTMEWIRDLREELGTNDSQEAYAALRSVLHTLRDRLRVEDAANFASQLPMLLIGVFYHGWTPTGKPEKIRSKDEFLEKIAAEFVRDMDPETVAKAVFKTIEKHMTSGEIDDIISNLPRPIAELWPEMVKK